MSWRLAGGAVLAAAAAGGVVVAAGGEDAASAAAAPARRGRPRPSSGTDLVDRENISGTLGYADAGTLACGGGGHADRAARPGQRSSRAGTRSTPSTTSRRAFLLYGTLPAWRDFAPGMTDGDDVRQLERNLRALGYDPGDVDGDWDWETTEAVEQFQRDRDLDDDGTLSRGEVVFRDGRDPDGRGEGRRRRPGRRPGKPLGEISSTERVVTRRPRRLAAAAGARGRPRDRRPAVRAHRRTAGSPRSARSRPSREDGDRRSASRSRSPAGRGTSTRRRSTSASPSSAAATRWPCRSRRCSPARAAGTRSRSSGAAWSGRARPVRRRHGRGRGRRAARGPEGGDGAMTAHAGRGRARRATRVDAVLRWSTCARPTRAASRRCAASR